MLSQVYQELAHSRNLTVDYHQQINIGGNTDFNNMMVQERLTSKTGMGDSIPELFMFSDLLLSCVMPVFLHH
ncbi:hypothetical protein C6H68_02805 [Photorhabdus luminescens]|nr:hypothetical protein C6H68_02805 [Photorhabdus luminescens]